jgi:hypothetical protein
VPFYVCPPRLKFDPNSKDATMKRPLLALAAAAALVAFNGCGWQMQNMQGNQCSDESPCAACAQGGGRFGQGRIGDGQLAERIRARAQMAPHHVQGDFLTGLKDLHHQNHQGLGVPGFEGATPTVTYPYYTVRGPRDYFLDDPMPIGY